MKTILISTTEKDEFVNQMAKIETDVDVIDIHFTTTTVNNSLDGKGVLNFAALIIVAE